MQIDCRPSNALFSQTCQYAGCLSPGKYFFSFVFNLSALSAICVVVASASETALLAARAYASAVYSFSHVSAAALANVQSSSVDARRYARMSVKTRQQLKVVCVLATFLSDVYRRRRHRRRARARALTSHKSMQTA